MSAARAGACLFVFFLAANFLRSDDWPTFRGPRYGAADDKSLPVELTEDNILWKIKLPGAGTSSPIIVGDKIIITFAHTDGGMIAQGGKLKGIAIAGKDHKWSWAESIIDGNTLTIWSSDVKDPAAVRYAWAGNPAGCNLCNGAGLPASPLRTDDWPSEK